MIKSFCGKCLDVNEEKAVAGNKIIQYKPTDAKNQAWYIQGLWFL